jgi:glycosyltransferase involved in cell wall biosynthesis
MGIDKLDPLRAEGDPPLVSIITPSFNQAPYLEATLRSVAAQDYPWIEHIIMDGGSDDGSVDIIRRWAESHDITWRSERDAGQADAIQRGAEMASGEIVGWLNSDDVYLDDHAVSDVVAAFGAGVSMVTGAGWHLAEDGRRQRRIPVYPDRVSHEALRCVDWVLQPATFVRRELFLRYPLDTTLHFTFDWDFFVRITQDAEAVAIDRDLAGYRLHPSGKSVSGGSRRQRELLEVTRRYRGKFSLRYFTVLSLTGLHLLADALPARPRRVLRRWLDSFARWTQRLTNGRGVPW